MRSLHHFLFIFWQTWSQRLIFCIMAALWQSGIWLLLCANWVLHRNNYDEYIACICYEEDKTDRQLAQNAKAEMLGSMFAHDQHQRSHFSQETACYAMQDEKRITGTTMPRPNMSVRTISALGHRRWPTPWISQFLRFFFLKPHTTLMCV